MRAVLALVALLPAIVAAQLQPNLTLEQASTALLTNRNVQAHLQLSKQQKDHLASVFKWFAEQGQSLAKTAKNRDEAQTKLAKIRTEAANRALKALKKEQKARLLQLGLQAYGPFAMMAPDVSPKIGLTADQKKRLLAIQADAAKKANAIFKERESAAKKVPQPKDKNNKAQVEKYMKELEKVMSSRNASDQKRAKAVRDEADRKALAVLTAAQKKKWDSMLGKKFPLSDRRA